MWSTAVRDEAIHFERDTNFLAERSQKNQLLHGTSHVSRHATRHIEVQKHTVVLTVGNNRVLEKQVFGNLVSPNLVHVDATSLGSLGAHKRLGFLLTFEVLCHCTEVLAVLGKKVLVEFHLDLFDSFTSATGRATDRERQHLFDSIDANNKIGRVQNRELCVERLTGVCIKQTILVPAKVFIGERSGLRAFFRIIGLTAIRRAFVLLF